MRRLLATFFILGASVTSALADPTDDVRKALVNFAGVSSYHLTFESKAQKGEADFVKPDKMHMTAGPAEVITIADGTYVKVLGNWMKLPRPMPQMQNAMLGYVRDLSSKPQDVTVDDLGPKSVDGASYHAYTVTPKGGKPATVYIDGAGLLVRVDADEGSVKLSNFNAPVNIEAPI